MGKIKNEFFDEINSGGKYELVYEPYIFKYTVYFYYNGEPRTIMADTFENIALLAKTIIPDFQAILEDSREIGYVFDCENWVLPVRLFENQNVIYK